MSLQNAPQNAVIMSFYRFFISKLIQPIATVIPSVDSYSKYGPTNLDTVCGQNFLAY